MDINKFSRIMIALGVLMCGAALAWWFYFYGRLASDVKASLSDMLPCLYSTSGACGLVSSLAQLGGATPYNPALLWAGLFLVLVGVVARFSRKS